MRLRRTRRLIFSEKTNGINCKASISNTPLKQTPPTALVHRIESATAPPEQQLEQREIEQSVRQSVDDLPASLRQPLDLVYYQGLKIREVAEKLNIPQGTVKSRLRRALLTLSQTFNQPASGETQSDSSRDIAPSTNRIDWQRQRMVAPSCCESETNRCG